ncbi:MAG: conserved repeat domain protein [Acidobacteriaceae bacterium]|nr:conserved repeat domain protein [Acidobacteriaceae bacterium]
MGKISSSYFVPICCALLILSSTSAAQHMGVKFEQLPSVSVGGKFFGFAKADLNHDGKIDVIAGVTDTGQVAVFLGIGDGTFQDPIFSPVNLGPLPHGIVVADFNGDGNPDVAIAEGLNGSNGANVDILLGNGDGTFQTAKVSPTGNSPTGLAVGDLDNDGHMDLFVGGNGGSIVLFGLGDGTFRPSSVPLSFGNGATNFSPLVVDLNKDGKLDLITANSVFGKFTVALGNGDGTFQPEQTYFTGWNSADQIASGDFNGDGNLDLVVVSFESNSATIYLGSASGVLTKGTSAFAGDGPEDVQVLDIDKDGKLDIVTSEYYSGKIQILYGNGNGLFPYLDEFGFSPAAGALVPGDFDGDGLPDLAFTASAGTSFSVLLQTTKTLSATTLNSSLNPSNLAQEITFTATVSSQAGTPTGTVTFRDGPTTLATSSLDVAGIATYATSSLPAGIHSISAVYNGDTIFAHSFSAALRQLVRDTSVIADLGVNIQSSLPAAISSSPVRLTIAVKNNGPANATNVSAVGNFSGTITSVNITTSQGTCIGSKIISCNIGNLASGATASITAVVVSPVAGTINATASAVSLQSDNNSTNDLATLNLPVVNAAPSIVSLSPGSAVVAGSSFTLAVTGANFVPTSQVLWNGQPRQTQFVNTTQLKATIDTADILSMGTAKVSVNSPSPGGGTTGQLDFVLYRLSDMTFKSILYDSFTKKLFGTVSSQAGTNGNSIAKVDPFSGSVESTTFIGSEPNLLAASDDGQFLYASLDGASAIRRFDLNGLSGGSVFYLGTADAFPASGYSYSAAGLAVLPGNPNSVAVARVSPYSNDYSVYDEGVKRPLSVTTFFSPNAIGFAGDSSFLFGSQQYSGITKMALDAQGLTSVATTINFPTLDFKWNGSRFFLGNGNVLDPSNLNQTQVQQYGGPIAIDSNRTYYLGNTSSPNVTGINAYDAATLQLKASLSLPWQIGFTKNLTRWGDDGFAFLNEDGHLVLMRSSITGKTSQDNVDLAVTIQASSDSLDIGSDAIYTATIMNAGSVATSDTLVSLVVPSNGWFISALPSQGSCSGTATVVCRIGALAPGASATLSVTVKMAYAGPAQSTVRVESPEHDLDTSNNMRSALVTVNPGIPLNPVPAVSNISTRPNYDPILLEGSGAALVHISGTHFLPSSTVQWEGQARTTTFVSSTELVVSVIAADVSSMGDFELKVFNPAPGGGASKFLVHVYRRLDLKLNQLVYDIFRDRFFAAVASNALNNANTIVTIDPGTGAVSNPIAVGNNPKKLFLTEDGQYLYFTTDNSSKVQRISVSTNALSTVFTVNTMGCNGPVGVTRIRAVPGYPQSVVVTFTDGCSRSYLAVFDNGIQRPVATDFNNISAPAGGDTIEFDSTGRNFFSGKGKFQLSSRGIEAAIATLTPSGHASYDAGFLYFDGGFVLDANSLQQQARLIGQGQFSNVNAGVPDSSLGSAFFMTGGSGFWGSTMNVFNLDTYTVNGVLPVNSASNVMRWSNNGLALFNESSYFDSQGAGSSVTFLKSAVITGDAPKNPRPAVSSISPAAGLLNGPQVVITVNGVQFVPSALVRWNGVDLNTTYVSDKQLTATAPASNMTTPGAAHVTVFNASPGGAESNITIFNVTPDSNSIQSLAPSSIGEGSTAFSLIVTGQNFTQDSVVKWNGTFRHTTFINSVSLKADINAADVANAGTASITVYDPLAATASPTTFTVAPAAIISFSPTSRFFPVQKIGTTSAPQSVTLTNTGSGPLQLTSISASDGFNVTNNCANPIAANASCSINITFSPSHSGAFSSSLTVVSNASSTDSVNLQGIPGSSIPFLNPTAFTFAPRAVFTNSDEQFISFSNQGNWPLTVTGVSVSGDFSIAQNSCITTLQPFFGCGISVRFRPTSMGVRTGKLMIASDNAQSPSVVELAGTGNDLVLTLVRPSRPTRSSGIQSAVRAEAVQIQVSGSSTEPVHLSCGPLPLGSRCEFGTQDFVLNGTRSVSLSVVGGTKNRSIRLRTRETASLAMRVKNESGSDSSMRTLNLQVTATSGSLQRSISVPISMQSPQP